MYTLSFTCLKYPEMLLIVKNQDCPLAEIKKIVPLPDPFFPGTLKHDFPPKNQNPLENYDFFPKSFGEMTPYYILELFPF